ncbi:MAG: LytTR family DNA-binding domain-containing protein [Ruminococcus flavefaciens]|nr:LytTR family DNA-binding domain-containing protein [Ruminococcus flavefaciens]
MRIAVCDDEVTFTNDFTAIIKKLYQSLEMTVDEFLDSKSFMKSFQNEPYDIVFLDIEMPETDGIALARQLRQQNEDVSIVFVIGYAEYAIKGYGFNVLRYLMKPVSENEIREILEYVLEKQNSQKFIWLTNRDGTHKIKVSNLLLIEAHNQNLIFNTISESIEVRGNINKYEEELKTDGFFRSHRSYIIALDKVTKISENEVMVANKFRVPIARARKQKFHSAFFSFVNKEAF